MFFLTSNKCVVCLVWETVTDWALVTAFESDIVGSWGEEKTPWWTSQYTIRKTNIEYIWEIYSKSMFMKKKISFCEHLFPTWLRYSLFIFIIHGYSMTAPKIWLFELKLVRALHQYNRGHGFGSHISGFIFRTASPCSYWTFLVFYDRGLGRGEGGGFFPPLRNSQNIKAMTTRLLR